MACSNPRKGPCDWFDRAGLDPDLALNRTEACFQGSKYPQHCVDVGEITYFHVAVVSIAASGDVAAVATTADQAGRPRENLD